MFTLRPYQTDAVSATLEHFRKTNEPAVIVLPTGAGKSLVIAELAKLAKRKILVLTHVKELVEQNHNKFVQYSDYSGVKSGVYSAGLKLKQTQFQVTFASVQSVVRNLNAFAAEYSLVIIDECHRVSQLQKTKADQDGGANAASPAVALAKNSQYGQIVQQLKTINPDLKILGLTATPYRMGMGWIYQYHHHGIKRSDSAKPFVRCIYELPLSYMIKHGFLTPPNMVDAPIAQYDFSALDSNKNGEYSEKEVNELLVKYPRVTQAITEQIEQLATTRQGVMIFAASIKHAKEIQGYLPTDQTALITGKTKLADREQLINQFKAKKLKFLVNVSVLTTGFDAPHVDFIAILRPTESVSLYQQIVGRGLRLNENKKDCLVVDYAGNGINIFYPEVGEKKPNSNSELVQVFCPSCGFANTFWGLKDSQGNITEHYGRKCQGFFESDEDDLGTGAEPERVDCDYRFRFKECEHCNAQNDIAARVCHACNEDIIDPDDKLKAALKLKNSLVIRCAGMSVQCLKPDQEHKLTITYYDEDGTELKESFDMSNKKVRFHFNKQFGSRLNNGATPTEFLNAQQVIDKQAQLSPPDFIVARKQKHFWQIQEKIFDYQGKYRKANELS
ncbi:DEAD/DEAH box helicase [uncultured Psychrosphaera sp.]|uniref:DEAD/DEAH box helicase n=1 Tax=uncultured Psychrosphaera sp. TaxID=1403522 RepID=UPI0026293C5D|nr:DEAD/DEAH box helicase [uncultured Psychrosphaera sp.]